MLGRVTMSFPKAVQSPTINSNLFGQLERVPYCHDAMEKGLRRNLSAGILVVFSVAAAGICVAQAKNANSEFGPGNPFYASSALPFQAPAFNKIKDSDYQRR